MNLGWRGDTECPESEIDDAIGTKYDDEPDKAPEDCGAPLHPRGLVAGMEDELKHAPDEDDKGARREEEDDWVDYLCDDLSEQFIENIHLS